MVVAVVPTVSEVHCGRLCVARKEAERREGGVMELPRATTGTAVRVSAACFCVGLTVGFVLNRRLRKIFKRWEDYL